MYTDTVVVAINMKGNLALSKCVGLNMFHILISYEIIYRY